MLDKTDYIKQFDTDGALETAATQYRQLKHGFSGVKIAGVKKPETVLVAGMGGSALAAELVKNWCQDSLSVPFEIIRGYDLPGYVNHSTLVICSSYSGNTEETLSIYEAARAKQTQLAVIASGGRLLDQAASHQVPVYEIPVGYQPRMAAWYGARALAELLESLGLISGKLAELDQAALFLENAAKNWEPEVLTADNQAKRLAEEMLGKAVWVYSGAVLAAAAYKWKIDINENAKQVASWNVLPEFNHNEFLGWTEHPRQKPFAVVQLLSSLDNPRIAKRFEVTNRLLSGRMPRAMQVEAEGSNRIEQLLWSCLLGDFASIYLAILNNVNPTKVEAIEKLKQELD